MNLDIGFLLSSLCIVRTDFYDRLLLATIGPLLVVMVLTATYRIAKERNKSSERAKRAVQKKHLSAALFVAFMIYSSVSFTVFQTFVCDTLDDGVSYLRADYSLTCATRRHTTYMSYACFMVFIYPIGIPSIFFSILLANKEYLKKVDRGTIPRLEPLQGLWAAYRPSRYYYEVIECGRRIALTGVAVFILPDSTAQVAVVLLIAVVFMFISESLCPFENRIDMALYRWGNGIILASMYLALLLKAEISEEGSKTLATFTGVIIAANAFMVVTILVQSFLLASAWGFRKRVVEIDEPVQRTMSHRLSGESKRSDRDGMVEQSEGKCGVNIRQKWNPSTILPGPSNSQVPSPSLQGVDWG